MVAAEMTLLYSLLFLFVFAHECSCVPLQERTQPRKGVPTFSHLADAGALDNANPSEDSKLHGGREGGKTDAAAHIGRGREGGSMVLMTEVASDDVTEASLTRTTPGETPATMETPTESHITLATSPESLTPLKSAHDSESSTESADASGSDVGGEAPVRLPVAMTGAGHSGEPPRGDPTSAAAGSAADRPGAPPEPTPSDAPLSRHRPAPGLAPSERKPSSRRTGVPELEMVANPSKPRKGVPPPPSGQDGAVTPADRPGVQMSPAPASEVAGIAERRPEAVFAGPEELAGAPEQAPDPNLARAHTSLIVGVAFIAAFMLVLGWFVFRRVADSWHHRHYRKMDFLVDGMYNN